MLELIEYAPGVTWAADDVGAEVAPGAGELAPVGTPAGATAAPTAGVS